MRGNKNKGSVCHLASTFVFFSLNKGHRKRYNSFHQNYHSERGKSAREQINGLALLAIVWNMEVTDLVTRIFGYLDR